MNMKQLLIIAAICALFFTNAYSQSYAWNFIISGNSLGNPIAFEKNNINNVYYGTGAKIFKSWDRGLTFTQIGTDIPSSTRVKCIMLSPKDTNLIVVGTEVGSIDQVRKSTDRGQTWQLTGSFVFSFFGIPITQDLAHPDTLYTMDNARFLRSTDFGSTWIEITSNVGCQTPCDIEVFPDSTNIILVGDNGTGIFRSTDYGQTWTQVFSTSGEIPTIACDKNTPGLAWATRWGSGGGFLKSTNYGITWTPITFFNGLSMWGVDVDPHLSNYIVVGKYSSPSQIYISKDGGLNWVTTSIPGSNYAICIIDTMNVFSAQSTGFYKLDAPWFVPVEFTSFSAEINGNDVKLIWSTATELNNRGFDVQMSSDGNNFQSVGFVPGFGTSAETRSYSFDIIGLKEGKYFFRLAQIDFDGTLSYSENILAEIVLPKEFLLWQNYPNPFNPTTKIKWQSPISSWQSLKIYDVLGNLVATLVDEFLPSGNYEVVFDAASSIQQPVSSIQHPASSNRNLASGVYLYKLQIGEQVQTKKMLLMK